MLLEQARLAPDKIISSDIDETPLKRETPRDYVLRLAREKAAEVAHRNEKAFILAADTAVACGRRILPKAEDQETARKCLELLSGRSHRVHSGVALIAPDKSLSSRVVETRVKVRVLDQEAIEEYLDSMEWEGKAGGYAIQGLFEKHILAITGSYSNVVGLPLYETANLLTGAGWRR